MTVKAPWLVAHSLVLAALIGPPPAAAQSRVGASNERAAQATERSNQVELFSPRAIGPRDARWRTLGDFTLPETKTDAFELEVPTVFPFSGLRLELVRYVGDEVSPLPIDDVDFDEELSVHDGRRNVADAEPLEQELRTHHVGVQGGLFNPSTDVIELGSLGFRVERRHGLTILRYRYSLNPQIDLVAEMRYWIGRGLTATSGEAKVTGGFIGPGIRVHAPKGTKGRRVVPFLQGNIYYVSEQVNVFDTHETLYEHGVGFGLSGGLDLEISRLISIPIEATYVANSGDLDDLSGFGISVGVNFNF